MMMMTKSCYVLLLLVCLCCSPVTLTMRHSSNDDPPNGVEWVDSTCTELEWWPSHHNNNRDNKNDTISESRFDLDNPPFFADNRSRCGWHRFIGQRPQLTRPHAPLPQRGHLHVSHRPGLLRHWRPPLRRTDDGGWLFSRSLAFFQICISWFRDGQNMYFVRIQNFDLLSS